VRQNLSVGRAQHCNVSHRICEQALGPYRCSFADPSQQRLISVLSLIRRRTAWGKEGQAVRRGDEHGDAGAGCIPGLFLTTKPRPSPTLITACALRLVRLGRRHALFGVTPAQYSAVGEALIWSLGEALGPALTRSRRDAWNDFYKVVQLSMLRGANRLGRGREPCKSPIDE
jgi:hypothetical protein